MSSLPPAPHSPRWPTTQWHLVDELHSDEETIKARALDKLCATYNRPILACLRDLGFPAEDAEDIRQRFFIVVIDRRRLFHRADARRGHLRDFLRRSLKRFASNIVRERRAQKRGGDIAHESLTTEHAPAPHTGTAPSPDEIFDREWAAGLLERAVKRLGDECAAKGKASLWQALQPHLARWDGPESQPAAAARLGLTASALSSELNRLRTRARHILLALLSETAATPREAEEDLRHLIRLLSR